MRPILIKSTIPAVLLALSHGLAIAANDDHAPAARSGYRYSQPYYPPAAGDAKPYRSGAEYSYPNRSRDDYTDYESTTDGYYTEYSEPAAPPSANATAADLLVARPGGLAATVLGAAVLVVGLPFTLINGSTGQAAQKLVVEPAEYTFTRPLGKDM